MVRGGALAAPKTAVQAQAQNFADNSSNEAELDQTVCGICNAQIESDEEFMQGARARALVVACRRAQATARLAPPLSTRLPPSCGPCQPFIRV